MFRFNTGRIAAITLLLSTAALPQTGLAASYLDTVPRGAKTSYTASLAEMTQGDSSLTTRTLDWRQPSVELYFDLPPSERTSEIVLTLSADPLTRVAPNTPLQVQFNNGEPVPVLSNGRGFEARLPLNAAMSRDRRNVIRITYPAPSGADCVSPAHGAWSVDLAESTLRMSGRTKTKNMSLADVSNFLRQPALTPKRVGLIARGPHGTDMQALAAQGISLRTPGVPNFSVTTQRTDFNVVMVKRSQLFDVTNDPMILNSEGPRVFVPRGRPTELIFTADTDADIVDMLEIFAERALPNTRRPISSIGEMNLQSRLNNGTVKVDGKTDLIDLAVASADPASGAQTYKFGVTDPAAMDGELLLRLSTNGDLPDTSRLRVTLNGKTLGAAKLNKKRKSVAFDIQNGTLNATSNVLTLVPDLDASKSFSCPMGGTANSGFSIGNGSRLKIRKSLAAPVTELSQLTSTGGLFAKSESYIALPRQTRDYQASLRILGRMAKAAGRGITTADYTRKGDVADDKHLLIIGPSELAKDHMEGAPKALREAFSGQSNTGDNLLLAGFERAASLGSDTVAIQYAAAQSSPRKINRGGVAALYGGGNGKLTGVISATPGSSFVEASRTLVQPGHWNALQGGVARWTSSSVVMAQTAQSDAAISKPKPRTGFKFPELGISALEDIQFHWPEIEWPEFDMPQVKLPEMNWPSFQSKKAEAPVQRGIMDEIVETAEFKIPDAVKTPVKVVNVTPRLKPDFKRPSQASTGLRGPFKFSVDTPKSKGSFQDLQRATRVKWSATKRWFKSKANSISDMRALKDAARATDRLQDRVEPMGRGMKTTLKDKLPGKGLVQLGDRTVSVYGLMLIMAFGFVLLLMSLARPTSRLGGRH